MAPRNRPFEKEGVSSLRFLMYFLREEEEVETRGEAEGENPKQAPH